MKFDWGLDSTAVCLDWYIQPKNELTRPTLNADKPSATLDP